MIFESFKLAVKSRIHEYCQIRKSKITSQLVRYGGLELLPSKSCTECDWKTRKGWECLRIVEVKRFDMLRFDNLCFKVETSSFQFQ